MKKNVWIFNHYATETFNNKGGRHFFFAKYLVENGFRVTIFCASTIHGSDEEIEIPNNFFDIKNIDGIDYVFIKTPKYSGNGKKRLFNMLSFYRKLLAFSRISERYCEKPDIILASSVHPLTLVAGIKISRKFGVKCICEVRDLWPETLVSYNYIKKNSIISRFMYFYEKKIYEKADAIIFTMEGGKDYILEKKWNKGNGGKIDLKKVYHINNGVDIELFYENSKKNFFEDSDLEDKKIFKIIYTGSIRKANNVGLIIDTAKHLMVYGYKNIKFLIWGDGDEKTFLEERCKKENITNVAFKGKVNKKYIPFILSKSDLNILNYTYYSVWKYGGSQNKYFEYLAAGKPILSTIKTGYDLLEKYNAGISLEIQTPEIISKAIIEFYLMNTEKYVEYCSNARRAAYDYDFSRSTKNLINIIENI